MPGIIHNNTESDIIAQPDRFNPFDVNVFEWYWGDEAPDEDTFGTEMMHATMSGLLKDPEALNDALSYFVGYSEYTGDLLKVKRWNPAVHPRWPMGRCAQVSIKGIKYAGTTSTLRTYNGSPRRLPCTNYENYRFDVTFSQPEFDYKEDSDVTTEWDRNITVDPLDEGEVISVDGGQYLVNAPTHPSINGVPPVLNGPYLKVYAQRSGLVVKAFGLPANFLLNDYAIPVHFLAAKGKANSTTFLGLPAGTLILLDYKPIKKAQPVATKNVGALQFGVTAEMHFGYTDPTRAEASETRRGWQLLPMNYGSGTGWFGVYNKFNTSEDLYPYYDMNKLLQHWST